MDEFYKTLQNKKNGWQPNLQNHVVLQTEFVLSLRRKLLDQGYISESFDFFNTVTSSLVKVGRHFEEFFGAWKHISPHVNSRKRKRSIFSYFKEKEEKRNERNRKKAKRDISEFFELFQQKILFHLNYNKNLTSAFKELETLKRGLPEEWHEKLHSVEGILNYFQYMEEMQNESKKEKEDFYDEIFSKPEDVIPESIRKMFEEEGGVASSLLLCLPNDFDKEKKEMPLTQSFVDALINLGKGLSQHQSIYFLVPLVYMLTYRSTRLSSLVQCKNILSSYCFTTADPNGFKQYIFFLQEFFPNLQEDILDAHKKLFELEPSCDFAFSFLLEHYQNEPALIIHLLIQRILLFPDDPALWRGLALTIHQESNSLDLTTFEEFKSRWWCNAYFNEKEVHPNEKVLVDKWVCSLHLRSISSLYSKFYEKVIPQLNDSESLMKDLEDTYDIILNKTKETLDKRLK